MLYYIIFMPAQIVLAGMFWGGVIFLGWQCVETFIGRRKQKARR